MKYLLCIFTLSLTTICHAQYYEDDCYLDDSYYDADYIVTSDNYDVYHGYVGHSSYDSRTNIVDYYDVEEGYIGYSEINRRTGIIDHYNVEAGYMGYSQIYLER